jgi:holliday junction DNA helicase RuvA
MVRPVRFPAEDIQHDKPYRPLPFFLYFRCMLAYLKGNFTLKTPTVVYVECHGVAYEVQVSLNTYSKIQNLNEGTLFTHLIIKEDAHVLYGFYDKTEKEVFQQLISVSGVGAATARVMLSSAQPNELVHAIITGNETLLESIKGIGKKTAQRIVLELKDKISKTATDTNISTLNHNTLEQEALTALTALGIARNAAESAIKKAGQTGTGTGRVEDLIKAALKCL